MVQLSHPYMTTGKTTAFTRWTFVFNEIVDSWSWADAPEMVLSPYLHEMGDL